MKQFVTLIAAMALLVPTMVLAEDGFPSDYREVSQVVSKSKCPGMIITRYENAEYKLTEHAFRDGNIIFLVLRNSDRQTYLKQVNSAEITSIPYSEAKALYDKALQLPVPDAIPICESLPISTNSQ